MWAGCFASIDCLLIWYRQQDDPFNAIAAGFFTGGLLAFRSGPQAAFKNALIGSVMLTLIEGMTVFITAYSMRMQQQMMEEQMALQKAELEKMLRRGGTDPWAVDFNKELAGRDIADPTEVMKYKAESY
jgi:import inner membrane translocase subunit TIM17